MLPFVVWLVLIVSLIASVAVAMTLPQPDRMGRHTGYRAPAWHHVAHSRNWHSVVSDDPAAGTGEKKVRKTETLPKLACPSRNFSKFSESALRLIHRCPDV
jgi:hypothetical protein